MDIVHMGIAPKIEIWYLMRFDVDWGFSTLFMFCLLKKGGSTEWGQGRLCCRNSLTWEEKKIHTAVLVKTEQRTTNVVNIYFIRHWHLNVLWNWLRLSRFLLHVNDVKASPQTDHIEIVNPLLITEKSHIWAFCCLFFSFPQNIEICVILMA